MTSCTGSSRGGFWGFWKSQLVENLTPNWKGRLSGLAEARRICALRAPPVMGGRWKSQNRKNVYLSPYVEEPLNSKVIKSFVPELRSRYVFFVFRDSYVICKYVMNILCTFHISVSWVWYTPALHYLTKPYENLNDKSSHVISATVCYCFLSGVFDKAYNLTLSLLDDIFNFVILYLF